MSKKGKILLSDSPKKELALSEKDLALKNLGQCLKNLGYQFTVVTPSTHAIVLQKMTNETRTHSSRTATDPLRDLFGWSRPVPRNALPERILSLGKAAEIFEDDGENVRSRVRFATYDGSIFMHSSYPTSEIDSVFLGPDSYRFARFLRQVIKHADKIADLGCGSGFGGMSLAKSLGRLGPAPRLYLTDINPVALNFAVVNQHINELDGVETFESNLYERLPEAIDTIIANPPFIVDADERTYRHGGCQYGSEVSVNIVKGALEYLAPGGQLALYTGACTVAGEDTFLKQVSALIPKQVFEWSYEELDPDIFGGVLGTPGYEGVERIAAVGLYLRRSPPASISIE